MSLNVGRTTREGPSLTTPNNANRVSVRSEEVGGGLPANATLLQIPEIKIHRRGYPFVDDRLQHQVDKRVVVQLHCLDYSLF